MAFERYIRDPDLLERFDMIALDRPGYNRNQPYNTYRFDLQVNFLNALIEQYSLPGQSLYFVSHSYGGPLCILSAESTKRVAGHIMLSPVIHAGTEPVFFVSPLPLIWPFAFISSPAMRFSAVEKLNHQRELIKHFAELYEKGTHAVSTWLVHGVKDWLAPMANVDASQGIVDPNMYHEVLFQDASHFIPWTRYEEIKSLIMELP